MIEFLHNHTNVIYQPAFDSPFFSGINPYTLGFMMFCDIRRICEAPTEEDKKWFPDFVGSDWIQTLDFAMRNFKDESFISQFLSPKIMRELKLFNILDQDERQELEVTLIHNDEGYHKLRQTLSENFSLSNSDPDIQIFSVDKKGDRSMTLHYTQHGNRPLGESVDEVLKHLYRLWGFPIKLESLAPDGTITLLGQCPALSVNDKKESDKEKR